MKILLVNPNQYDAPPVPPLGLEYLYGALSETHHTTFFSDLCFVDNPSETLKNTISEIQPDIIGISIRQIDSALYFTNVFFLDGIKDYIEICKSFDIPVVLGGSGFSIMPRDILAHTGADYGIYGPGEFAFKHLLDKLEKGDKPEKIINGYKAFSKKTYKQSRKNIADYQTYLNNEGTIGFRTQIGCTESCFFCVEGNKPLLFHEPGSVASELYNLKQSGYNNFHLCDSEFNQDLQHCIDVCNAIISTTGPVNWALYMKPEPVSGELFQLLRKSGTFLITLSIDSYNDTMKGFSHLERFFKYAKSNNIPVIIDLSVGYPYEDIAHTKELLDFLNTQPVSSVGVNSYYRVYPNTPLFQTIKENKDLQSYIINKNTGHNYIYPLFFAYFHHEDLVSVIPGKEKFRIEGFEKATNYQRIKDRSL